MTKKMLLDRAKTLGLVGRHEMTRDALAAAVSASETKRVSDPVKKTRPWTPKFYFVDVATLEARSEELKKAPTQVQLMLRFMVERGVTSAETARRGSEVAVEAVESGFVKTVSEPQVLFSYYARKMENLGLSLRG